MPQPVQDAVRAGVAPERALGDDRIDERHSSEARREQVDRAWSEREPPGPAGSERHTPRGDAEQDLLPGKNHVQRRATDARAEEQGGREVVERQPDDEEMQRGDRPPPDAYRRSTKQGEVHREGKRGHDYARRRRRNTSWLWR